MLGAIALIAIVLIIIGVALLSIAMIYLYDKKKYKAMLTVVIGFVLYLILMPFIILFITYLIF